MALGEQLKLFVKPKKPQMSFEPIDVITRLMSSEYEYFQKLGVFKFRKIFLNNSNFKK